MQDEQLRFLPFNVLYLSHQNGGIQKHDYQKWRIERKARTKAKPWLVEQQAKQNMNIFYVLCPIWKYEEESSWRLEASLFSSVFRLTMPCLKGYIFNTTFKRTFNLDKIKSYRFKNSIQKIHKLDHSIRKIYRLEKNCTVFLNQMFT